ncbi:SIMPL domain-containing protein [Chloroflexota bacterium]
MKKTWLMIIGLVMILTVIGFTGCGNPGTDTINYTSGEEGNLKINLNSQQEGIWVSGQGKVATVPDIANLQLGIEAQETSVALAQSQAAEAMDRVMKSLSSNGVAKKDIQTQYFNISRVTRWDEKNQQEIVIGYRVTNSVTAKIRDIEKTGTIIDAVAIAGGDLTRFNGIYLSVDDPKPYQKEARDKAVADARDKAEQLASQAGVKLGKATYISENLYYPPTPRLGGLMIKAAAPEMAPTPISPGETEIALSVQIAYAILN